jgi:hypothetical protein
LENHPSGVPKFTKNCNMMEWKIGNNFPCGNKLKFETGFRLKTLEAKLLMNLGQIYWEFKLV